YTPSRHGAAVVLAHGAVADRAQLAGELRILQRAGFGVLAFDWPGRGESGGRVTYGPSERDALRAAVSYVAARPDVDPSRIGALGFSIGAALVACEAERDDRLRALVLVAPFADSDEQTKLEFARWGPLTAWPAVWVDHALMPDGPLRPVDAVRDLAGRSLLIVEGTEDHVVPPWMSDEVYVAARAAKKERLVVPGASHMTYEAYLDGAFGRRVAQFFEDSLARPPSSSRSP
ncbi:MAG: alpha/beta hydrolase, partial [Polyangiaceae bacterium]